MVTTIHSLFDHATADRHMYDRGGVSSFDSHSQQGATTFSKLEVQFLGITNLLQKKN